MATDNPFTARVVAAMQQMYPEALADKAWDNVGLLLANTLPAGAGTAAPKPKRVLLCNDLTPRVVDEAIHYGAGVVVAYHPLIFRGLKAITQADPQQDSLIRLAQSNIAVYAPHTALDAAPGGINDWLADAVADASVQSAMSTAAVAAIRPLSPAQEAAIAPGSTYRPEGANRGIAGYGRLVTLSQPVSTRVLIARVVRALGLLDDADAAATTLQHVLVARPRTKFAPTLENTVSSVAVCAGSGADVLRDTTADLLLTGEMSHHDALAATVRGKWVVCLLHSNSERLFLRQRLQGQLQARLNEPNGEGLTDACEVLVSDADRDPFEIWDLTAPLADETVETQTARV